MHLIESIDWVVDRGLDRTRLDWVVDWIALEHVRMK